MGTDGAGVPDDPGTTTVDGVAGVDWRQLKDTPVIVAVNDGTTVHGVIKGEYDNGDGTFSIEVSEDGTGVGWATRRIPVANVTSITSDSIGG